MTWQFVLINNARTRKNQRNEHHLFYLLLFEFLVQSTYRKIYDGESSSKLNRFSEDIEEQTDEHRHPRYVHKSFTQEIEGHVRGTHRRHNDDGTSIDHLAL